VFGLGGRPGAKLDVEISRMKGRDSTQPLIRVAADVGELRRAIPEAEWTRDAQRLAERFWPGPLTLVLAVRGDVTGAGVAVRVTAHPVLRRVLEKSGGVMTSTSLNLAGETPATTVDQARAGVQRLPAARRPFALLESGDLEPAIPSTLLSLSGERPRLLRLGAIGREEITELLSSGASGGSP
jgi:L-threonylcarbamoyladenylate synthase